MQDQPCAGHESFQGLPFRPDFGAEDVIQGRKTIQSFTREPSNRDWFALLVDEARRFSGGDADRWLRVMESQGCVYTTPVWNESGASWPKGRSTGNATNVRWTFHSEVTKGKLLSSLYAAPTPEMAEGTYSLGPQLEAAPVSAADALYRHAKSLHGPSAKQIVSDARHLMVKTRDLHLDNQPIHEPEVLAVTLLDRIADAAGASRGVEFDPILTLLEALA